MYSFAIQARELRPLQRRRGARRGREAAALRADVVTTGKLQLNSFATWG